MGQPVAPGRRRPRCPGRVAAAPLGSGRPGRLAADASVSATAAVCCHASAAASTRGTHGSTSLRPRSTCAGGPGRRHRTPSRTTRTPTPGGPPHERASPTRTSKSRGDVIAAQRRHGVDDERVRRAPAGRGAGLRAAAGCRPRRWRTAAPRRRCPGAARARRHASRSTRPDASTPTSASRTASSARAAASRAGTSTAECSTADGDHPRRRAAGGRTATPSTTGGTARRARWAGRPARPDAHPDRRRRPPGRWSSRRRAGPALGVQPRAGRPSRRRAAASRVSRGGGVQWPAGGVEQRSATGAGPVSTRAERIGWLAGRSVGCAHRHVIAAQAVPSCRAC